jgi:regulatory protein
MADSELFREAVGKATSLCSAREQCISDIRLKAPSWGLEGEDIDRLVEYLLKEKYIDEQRYANAFTRERFNIEKWGKVKITSHLKFKGIASEIISNALESIDPETYLKTIRGLIASARLRTEARNKFDMKAKLMRYGLSKGYESSILYEVIGE